MINDLVFGVMPQHAEFFKFFLKNANPCVFLHVCVMYIYIELAVHGGARATTTFF
jgi:hypothetical protein